MKNILTLLFIFFYLFANSQIIIPPAGKLKTLTVSGSGTIAKNLTIGDTLRLIRTASNDTMSFYQDASTTYWSSTNPVTLNNSFQHDSIVNVKNYGAVGNGTSVNNTAFLTAWNAMSYNGTFYIPSGNYNLTSTLRLHNKGNVRIICEGAILNGLTSADTIISINGCNSVNIKGIIINMNNKASQVDYGLVVKNVKNKVDISECRFYNFGTWNAYGLTLHDVGNLHAINSYNDGEAFSINRCSFYNDNIVLMSAYSYASNNTKGIGISLRDSAEYGRISDCDFFNISTGVESNGGANNSIINSNFEDCNNYQNSALQLGGCIYIKDSGGNGGKYTIQGNHMNHNYANVILIDYDGANGRPCTITGNQIIANQYDPITINVANAIYYNMISNNFFDRCYNALALPTYPFTGNRSFIKINNAQYNTISNNVFIDGNSYGIITRGISDKNFITNNNYTSITTAWDSLIGINDIDINNQNLATARGDFNVTKRINFAGSNMYLGRDAAKGSTGTNNQIMGTDAASGSFTGTGNLLIGFNAALAGTSADYNTLIGDNNTFRLTSGDNNTVLGRAAGVQITTGSNNVYLGYNAGGTANESNKLNIDITSNNNPLLGGDFSTRVLTTSATSFTYDSLPIPRGRDRLIPSGTRTYTPTCAGSGTIVVDSAGITKLIALVHWDADATTYIDLIQYIAVSSSYITYSTANTAGNYLSFVDNGASFYIKNNRSYTLNYSLK